MSLQFLEWVSVCRSFTVFSLNSGLLVLGLGRYGQSQMTEAEHYDTLVQDMHHSRSFLVTGVRSSSVRVTLLIYSSKSVSCSSMFHGLHIWVGFRYVIRNPYVTTPFCLCKEDSTSDVRVPLLLKFVY